jgi:hypothetical protein
MLSLLLDEVPKLPRRLQPSEDMCGRTAMEALSSSAELEAATRPAEKGIDGR